MKTGVEEIAAERAEQQVKHGYDVISDCNNYDEGEIARAVCAIIYDSPPNMPAEFIAPDWGWEIREHKQKKYADVVLLIERYKVGGALLAAEIDRLKALPGFKESQ